MKLLRSMSIAFSMYSKIPMPQFEWKEEDMRYSLCFFPWVGAVIAIAFFFLGEGAKKCGMSPLFIVCILAALPILITGGIHVDGYMDTMDALHSYQPKEEKLRILKDPHIGAFSVIMVLLYYFLYLGFLSEIQDKETLFIVALGFIISRALSGIGVVSFMPAKKDGLLRAFADPAMKRNVRILLGTELLVGCLAGSVLDLRKMILVILAAGCAMAYYKRRAYREFGGITGDTAGWFVQICELVILIAAVADGWF